MIETGVTVADVRAWAGVSPGSITDEQLQQVLDAEAAIQQRRCPPGATWDEATGFPDALKQALYRRVARECAARGLPLGVLSDISEMGPMQLPQYDQEISRLESYYRKFGIA